jgi:Mg-chelatase subunit ChlD
MEWTEFTEFLAIRVRELAETDFDQIRFGNMPMALLLALTVVVAAVFTIMRMASTKRSHSRQHSGHRIPRKYQRGTVAKAIYGVPKLLLALSLVALLVAVSDPFLTATEEVTGDVESRVRIDLVDTSLSMAWAFPPLETSRAAIAREAHLEFLEMRRGKNDRVSLWVFSSYPYMIDDFVIDDDLYYFQVMDAPYATVKILAPQSGQSLDRLYVPRDKVQIIPSEGTTNMIRALQAIVKHFDQDDATTRTGATEHRALLIITDGAADELPEDEFEALNQRNIVPYVIYINVDDPSSIPEGFEKPPLIERIREFGGDYFAVTDAASLERAYLAIDERETVRIELTHRAIKVPIYSRFLLISMALLLVGIPSGFLAELLWGTHP